MNTPTVPLEPPRPPSKPLAPGDLTKPIELRDFMHGVGELMALPPKRPTRPSMHAVPAVKARPARSGARAFVLPGVAGVLGLLTAALTVIRPTPVVDVPPPMLGEWTTKDAKYAGRALRITPTDVSLGTGERQDAAAYPLVRAVPSTRGDSMIVEMEYLADGEAMPMRLAYARSAPGKLAIANPAGLVWERAAAR
jgi:hypothetical protein